MKLMVSTFDNIHNTFHYNVKTKAGIMSTNKQNRKRMIVVRRIPMCIVSPTDEERNDPEQKALRERSRQYNLLMDASKPELVEFREEDCGFTWEELGHKSDYYGPTLEEFNARYETY